MPTVLRERRSADLALQDVGVAFIAGVQICIRGGEGVRDALVGRVGLLVDAVGVELEQDGDGVPARRATSVRVLRSSATATQPRAAGRRGGSP